MTVTVITVAGGKDTYRVHLADVEADRPVEDQAIESLVKAWPELADRKPKVIDVVEVQS